MQNPRERGHHQFQKSAYFKNQKMDEILNALRNIQKELDEQKIAIQVSGDNVTDRVTQNINKILENKFTLWEEKHNILEEKIENQEKRLYYLEKQARQKNIVFFGLEEKETSYNGLEKTIIEWIDINLSIKLGDRDIQQVRRIGKKGVKPRPITATFLTLGLKINIFKQKRLLKGTQFYMTEDYPNYILEKRKELREQVKAETEKGNTAIIKYDKLIILNQKNNKRTLTDSPESNNQPQSNKNAQPTKKNKTIQQQSSVRRSNSMSDGVVKPGMLNFLVTKTVNNQVNTDKHT